MAFASKSSAQDKPVLVEMQTSMGLIRLQLYPDKAPKTVQNFVKYAQEGYFDGTIFHRVIDGFMIQGGGHLADLSPKAEKRDPIVNESATGIDNKPYTIAMARTSDPHSATSQFFINVADNEMLNRAKCPDGWGYCAFGEVIEGKEVVDEIAKVRTGTRARMGDVPVETVTIEKVTVVE
jgi:cyclophilin family peptidyl-prolyl cis-trans isomerase